LQRADLSELGLVLEHDPEKHVLGLDRSDDAQTTSWSGMTLRK
jgi:hypothetical protein